MPIETIEDPSIKLRVTEQLVNFIKKDLKNVENLPAGIKQLKSNKNRCKDDHVLLLEDVKWLNLHLKERRKNSEEKVYLHELLKNSELILPQPKVTPRNPVLEARIQKLTAQQNAREYAAMTKSVDSIRRRLPEDTIAYQMKQINKQLIAVAQFVFSVIAGFAFGFIGVELIVGNLDFGFRLLLGIICALVIALAEIYFLAVKLSEDVVDPHSTSCKKMHQD